MIRPGGARPSWRRALMSVTGAAVAVVVATGSVTAASGWTTPRRITNASATIYPSVLEGALMDGANTLHAIWSDGLDLRYGRKPAGGGWAFQTIHGGYSTEFGDVEGVEPSVSVDAATGKVYVAFVQNSCIDVCETDSVNRTYVITNAFGTHTDGTWKEIFESDTGDNDPFIRVVGGRVHLVFARADVGIVHRSRPTAAGGTWSAARTLAAAPMTHEWVAAASVLRFDGQGDLHLAYQHTGANAHAEPIQAGIRYVEWRPGTTWSRLRSLTITSAAAGHPNLVLDRGGNAHAAFTRPTGTAVGTYYRRLPTGATAQWSTVQRASTAAWSAALTLDANDFPALVVTDVDGVYYKKRRTDGTWPAGTNLAPFGTDAVVRIDSANKAHVLFANLTRRTVAGVVREAGTYLTRQS